MATPSTFRKYQTILLGAGHMINDSYNGFLAPLLPFLMQKYGLSLALTAALATISTTSASLIQPLQGLIADKFTHRYFVALGPFLTATFMGFVGIAPGYSFLVIFLILSGIGTSLFHPQAATMVKQTSGDKAGLGMSIFVTGGTIGAALGPVMILLTIQYLGLEYSLVTTIPGLLIAYLLFRYAPNIENGKNQTADPELKSNRNGSQVFYLSLLTGIAILRAVAISSLHIFSPLYLIQVNFTKETAGLSAVVWGISLGIGSFLGGIFSDWIGRKRTIFLSLISSVPFIAGFLFFPGVIKFAFLGLVGFTLGSSLPVSIVMAQELAPNHTSTAASLMMGFCWGIAGFILTPLGALGDSIGLETVLWGIALLPFVTVLLLIPIPRTQTTPISA